MGRAAPGRAGRRWPPPPGFHAVIARIVGGHEASIALHRGQGFELVGTEREVGRKFNRWLDVVVLQTAVGSHFPLNGGGKLPT